MGKARSNGKHPGGRPTKYLPEYCQQVIEYFQSHSAIGANLCTLVDFAELINVEVGSIYEWQHVYPEFSKSIKTALHFQERQLCNSGLQGEYNPAMSIFLLKNNHGYKDKFEHDAKIEIEVTAVDGLRSLLTQPTLTEPVEAITNGHNGNGLDHSGR